MSAIIRITRPDHTVLLGGVTAVTVRQVGGRVELLVTAPADVAIQLSPDSATDLRMVQHAQDLKRTCAGPRTCHGGARWCKRCGGVAETCDLGDECRHHSHAPAPRSAACVACGAALTDPSAARRADGAAPRCAACAELGAVPEAWRVREALSPHIEAE